MSKVLRPSVMLFVLFILSIASSLPYTYDRSTPEELGNCSTRRIVTRRGVLCGKVKHLVVKQHGATNHQFLRSVEQYLGIPYASPPVGELRFMPPGSAPKWSGTKMAMNFGPVCPQKFPSTFGMRPERKNYFEDLKQHLRNQSEDCLYLNVYAPFQDADERNHFPVMVFLHGESFEWNSGNPYDGSVLASYGRVIVVTLNFRLGILGFLNANFGLVDQIAALLWVQENIEAFGGDPNRITVFGHGTGAACASLLMLSPMVQSGEGNKLLFQRAILMGGTALSDWAIAKEWHVTYQVSSAFNCPVGPDFLSCLGKKRLEDLVNFTPQTQQYATRFGPVVDGRVVPNNSLEKLMTTYSDLFSRFDLMLGTSEVESLHLLNSIALTHGLLEKELLQELRNYLTPYCEMNLELCIKRTLEEYKDEQDTNEERAIIARNTLLDILSDSRTVAPLLLTAKHHTPLNPDTETFFYVFAHRTASKVYVRDQTYHGEELPYIFGIPLMETNSPFADYYTEQEQLLSEAIMTYWSNFAYEGNPNVPVKDKFNTLTPMDWMSFRVDWPSFDNEEQQFLFLAYPPIVSQRYRSKQMRYWQEIFPNIRKNYTIYVPPTKKSKFTNRFNDFPKEFVQPTFVPNYITRKEHLESSHRTPAPEVFGKVILSPEEPPPGNIESPAVGQTTQRSGWTKNNLIIVGGIFLAANLILFLALYYKCTSKKKSNVVINNSDDPINVEESSSKMAPHFDANGCNFIGMIVKASKNEVVKVGDDASSSKAKLTRNISSSTLDAHTKVREWITQEIVQKCSPAFLRQSRDTEQSNLSRIRPPLIRSDSKTVESNSTLGRSPTRPVSPAGKTSQSGVVSSKLPSKKSVEKNSTGGISKFSSQQLPDKSKHKNRADKVSVAVDATPAGRGSSVMRQQPIELTKSLDCTSSGIEKEVPLRRSVTLDNVCSPSQVVEKTDNLRKSTTSVNLQHKQMQEPTVVKIMHFHSRSDPVQDLHNFTPPPKLKTFTPDADVNVTSRDDSETTEVPLLTPEQALVTIKRRNFPKVLPDFPSRQAIEQKRRSMPAPNTFLPATSEGRAYARLPCGKSHLRLAPIPPPRTSSTLARQGSVPSPICHSAPILAAEPPVIEEPELTCNNLYFGPLKSSREAIKKSELKSPQEIYESLKPQRPIEPKPEIKGAPKSVVTTDPDHPIKRMEPKVVIRPKISRNVSKNTGIPRVTATDNATYVNISDLKPHHEETKVSQRSAIPVMTEEGKCKRPSHISSKKKSVEPCVNNGSSSSESTTPSEESDTGTVVKRK